MSARGSLFIWPHRRLLYAPQGIDNTPHAHPAFSLIIALQGQFELQIEGDKARTIDACLLAPRCKHRLQAQGTALCVLHIDLGDARFESLLHLLEGHRLLLPDDLHINEMREPSQQLVQGFDCCRDAYQLGERLLHTWTTSNPRTKDRDPRIDRCLRLIANTLPEPISVEELAFSVDLSPTRLMHLFKADMGMPIRRFVLWARLRGAVNALQEHHSLTDAAHAMGFADSAHLSRTFSQMFGIPPSQVLTHNRFVQAHFCEDT